MLHDIHHIVAPFIWGTVVLVMVYLRHQRKMAEIAAGQTRPDASASVDARELARLRERVRVLERIATDQARHDSPHALAAHIDALRD